MAQRRIVDALQQAPGVAAQRRQIQALSTAAQRQEAFAKSNRSGLPDTLKNGIEALSGLSMDGVRVHYNSAQPAQLNALAYAQGTDIHLAPGQERHLPHEAWHVVQQAQGRARPTLQMKSGMPVNDDPALEQEADAMGAKAVQMRAAPVAEGLSQLTLSPAVVQGKLSFGEDFQSHHLTSEFSDDTAAARYRARGQENTIVSKGDIDAEDKAIKNEASASYGNYDFQVTPDVNVLKAALSTTNPKMIAITEHKKPTLMGYKAGTDYNITHLHASGEQTAIKSPKWLDPKYGKAYEARSITIKVRGKNKKEEAERLKEVDQSLTAKGSIATRKTSKNIITLSYTRDGDALGEFDKLATLLAQTGNFKMTCKLTDDYTKTF